jgi:hypothetical protein
MRTKTMLLSALLGGLGSVSVMAQTNVYSLNVVGYINCTMQPGYNLITCPLIASPNNTIATLLNNTNEQYQNGGRSTAVVYQYTGGTYSATDTAEYTNVPSGWAAGGTITMNPGQAIFFYNPTVSNMYATFVGTVPSGTLTNALAPGYNLVGSMVPMSGDLVTNSISDFTNGQGSGRTEDFLYTYSPGVGYNTYGYSGGWLPSDPTITNVYAGFFFLNDFTSTNYWIETYNP